MPVIPCRADLFQDRKDLYQFLVACQNTSLEKHCPQIASISLEIDVVDPLAVLQQLGKPDQPHFYFERRFKGEAIAAIGTAKYLETEGHERFSKIQQFIDSCLDNLILNASCHPSLTEPRFFCNLNFFDQPQTANSPFPSATIFLPRWQILTNHNHCLVTTNLVIDPWVELETLIEEVWHQFQAIRLAKLCFFSLPRSVKHNLQQWQVTDIHNFREQVITALNAIRTHALEKIVLAHAIDVISPIQFQWIESVDNLRHLYPDCCVFSVSNGKAHSFIGASPERLISSRDRTLTTDALAGSAPRGRNVAEDTELAKRLLRSKKERHEHQVVVDFMTERLLHLGLQPQLAKVPKLLQLSNIQHLHTPIKAIIPASLHPLEILAELHPTPAVAGMPRNIACDYIHQHEPFERSLYAAPLGWIDAQGNTEFIVGIRSALVNGYHARLYAGAGIVVGSDPDREVAEIKLKLQALLQALV
jgi:menaquinone-specific isochorismate synthase